MIITKELLAHGSTEKNGFTKAQIQYAQTLFPGRWKAKMLGSDVEQGFWDEFVSLKTRKAIKNQKKKDKKIQKKNKKLMDALTKFSKAGGICQPAKKESKVINSVSPNNGKDWSWKPDNSDIPKIKLKPSKNNKNRGKNKEKRAKISKQDNEDFYWSREWRELRHRVLKKYECKCMMCGRSPRDHGIVIHVDHIKPRSKHPELSLRFENLQLLCEDCNLGKGNKDDTDWRPHQDKDAEALDMIMLSDPNSIYQ